MKFKKSDFQPGDILTFDYISPTQINIKCEFIEFYTHKDWKQNYFKLRVKLLEDISYTSTHHGGEKFKTGYIWDVLMIDQIKTINNRTPFQLKFDNIKKLLKF